MSPLPGTKKKPTPVKPKPKPNKPKAEKPVTKPVKPVEKKPEVNADALFKGSKNKSGGQGTSGTKDEDMGSKMGDGKITSNKGNTPSGVGKGGSWRFEGSANPVVEGQGHEIKLALYDVILPELIPAFGRKNFSLRTDVPLRLSMRSKFVGENITQLQFEEEMPIIFQALERTWELAY